MFLKLQNYTEFTNELSNDSLSEMTEGIGNGTNDSLYEEDSKNYVRNYTNKTCHIYDYYGHDYEYYEEQLEEKAVEILKYFPLFIWIGSLLNLLVIHVLMKKRNRNFSTSVYLTSLAFADLANGFYSLMVWMENMRIIERTYSTTDCIIRYTLGMAFINVSNWLLAVISVERLICVTCPFKVRKTCSVKLSRILAVIVWVAGTVVQALQLNVFYRLEMIEVVEYELHQICVEEPVAVCEFHNKVVMGDTYYRILSSLQSVLLPYLTILISTTVIVYFLKFENMRQKRHKAAIKMLLILNFIYLFTNLPEVFIELSETIIEWQNHLERTIAGCLRELNFVVNFFVYFLSGSKFRNELYGLFMKERNKK